jgi:hypothetical protein
MEPYEALCIAFFLAKTKTPFESQHIYRWNFSVQRAVQAV